MAVQHEGDMYAHLLQRIALALEGAETDRTFRNRSSAELEISGLSALEMALIQAYLQHDPELHGDLSASPAATPRRQTCPPRFLRTSHRPAGRLSPRGLPR